VPPAWQRTPSGIADRTSPSLSGVAALAQRHRNGGGGLGRWSGDFEKRTISPLLEVSDDEREKLNWEVGKREKTGGKGTVLWLLVFRGWHRAS